MTRSADPQLSSEAERRLDCKIVARLLATNRLLESQDPVRSRASLPFRGTPSQPQTSQVASSAKLSPSRQLTSASVSTATCDSSSDASDLTPLHRNRFENQSSFSDAMRGSFASCEVSRAASAYDTELDEKRSNREGKTPRSRDSSVHHRRNDELSIDGPTTDNEVFLHVYDLHPLTQWTGLNIFHTGVEVHGCECSFGSKGLQWVSPGCMGAGHREIFPLGPTHLTAKEVLQLAAILSEDWRGCDYNIFHNNCQTFAIEFCRCLGVPRAIPEEFVRFAKWT
eukprot:CAMPEP_0194489886 /NCGR_PEP_ID=MMETSP0253-20130528/9279_1 /TAXON_ID=2966 /ORGANISM="Noctiluca scintillans" /LENGTH=281 /DNA_ID=CAMNT_0039330429 /DNA_START=27 /DNA_END=872 /DNA_ORIENTATION=-